MTKKRLVWVLGARLGQTHSSMWIYYCFHLLCYHPSCILLIVNLHINIYYCSGPRKDSRALEIKGSTDKLLTLQLQLGRAQPAAAQRLAAWSYRSTQAEVSFACEFKTPLKSKWKDSSEDWRVSPCQNFLRCPWCSECGWPLLLLIFVVGSNLWIIFEVKQRLNFWSKCTRHDLYIS